MMTEAIELHDSEVAAVQVVGGAVCIEFSEAYIWDEEKGWAQRARLVLEDAQVRETPKDFPVTKSEGLLKGGEMRVDNIVLLPFSEPGIFWVEFLFSSGENLRATGHNPRVGLIGERRFIEEAGQR